MRVREVRVRVRVREVRVREGSGSERSWLKEAIHGLGAV